MGGQGKWHIRTEGVRKRYRGADRDAVHSLDLTVPRGSVFGILGPNGAGKTTTLSMLCGLLDPDGGRIRFADRAHDGPNRIGLVPQNVALYPRLNARENLEFFGGLHGLSGAVLRRRIAQLLEDIGLTDRAEDRIDTYSSGMARRLNLVAGLVHEPEILLLDEPTVGIDPQSRNRVFELVLELRDRDVTVLYTTHYMEEASRLCDYVAIMDRGAVIAEDAPRALVESLGAYTVELHASGFPEAMAEELAEVDVAVEAELREGILAITTPDADGAMQLLEQLMPMAERHQIELELRRVAEASLESVFLNLTGRSLRDEVE